MKKQNLAASISHPMIRFTIVTAAYLVFWGPLFLVTLVHARMDWTDARSSVTHQVCLHVAFVHAAVNPLLFLMLQGSLRTAVLDFICCRLCPLSTRPHIPTPGQNGAVVGSRKETA